MAKRKISGRKSAPFRSKKKSAGLSQFLRWVIFLGVFGLAVFVFRDNLAYYLGFKSDKVLANSPEAKKRARERNSRILDLHQDKVIGVDVSEYQGTINWENFGEVNPSTDVGFVFVRATVGRNRVDRRFRKNWRGVLKAEIIRGAYHYYRPNENSIEQAELFIRTVKLSKGDLPPVLDIEKLPRTQSLANLRLGLKRWLEKVEEHYKVKPIIYSGDSYYNDFLEEEFDDYPLWIANYTDEIEDIDSDWRFWQFTESASVSGVKGKVDLNVFNGDYSDLRELRIE